MDIEDADDEVEVEGVKDDDNDDDEGLNFNDFPFLPLSNG